MIEKFVNKYPISKTLCFKLTPVGRTKENIKDKMILKQDIELNNNAQIVKGYMDRYYKHYIDSVLSAVSFETEIKGTIERYAKLYFITSRSIKESDDLDKIEKKLCSAIAETFTKDERYKKLNKKEFIKEVLPEYLTDQNEKNIVAKFNKAVTYFTGFWENRANIFSKDVKAGAIGYRCIVDNLPKFLDNVKSYEKISAVLREDVLKALEEKVSELTGNELKDMFTVDYFSFALSQTEITHYNNAVGEINKQINLYNQQIAKGDRSKRLPLLKALYKQILSDRESIFIIPEEIKDDDEALSLINNYFNGITDQNGMLVELKNIFEGFSEYDHDGIHIKAGAPVTDISNAVFGSRSTISEAWNNEYEQAHPLKPGKEESYYDNEKKEYKKIKSFPITELQRLGGESGSIVKYYSETVCELIDKIKTDYAGQSDFLSKPYNENKRLSANDKRVADIKDLLDDVKALEKLVKPLEGTGKEEEKDNEFYARFLPLLGEFTSADFIYNRIRNYVTKKPYSNKKIKLNFDTSQLMQGWDVNKEKDCLAVLMRRHKNYYIGIMEKKHNKIFKNTPNAADDEEYYNKVIYKQIQDAKKYISKKQIMPQDPPKHIVEFLQKKELDKESLTHAEIITFIDYCQNDFLVNYPMIIDENGKNYFSFVFKAPEDYESLDDFFEDVEKQAYRISYKKIPVSYIDELVDTGKLYLFQFSNKDFSPYSKKKPNLHTMYFKILFDECNLENVVYKLRGGAEMFYREASIKKNEMVIHHANEKLENKNPDNKKKESVFEYDIIKDKRYTKPQFSLHMSIEMNFKAPNEKFINDEIREELKTKKNVYLIGIDRGERNLIYTSVIDSNGKIVEQRSWNLIGEETGHAVDYQKLLDKREGEMDKARKDWKTIGSIANIKEGYLSQVIHYICELVVKYDAIIAMEDLSDGFVKRRVSIGKQVYKKFENMLTEKLNYLVRKSNDINEPGGLLKAYQLTNKVDGKTRTAIQNGIIFYVPAWLTSKIDPTTGFVSLLNPKYTNREAAREFFGRFDDIRYNAAEGYFELDLDYDKFPKCNYDYRKKWTVCTYGDRIETFRNPDNNNKWDNKKVDLTAEYKNLFKEFGIDIEGDIKGQIITQNTEKFFRGLIRLLRLTLQMRNSITKNVDVDYIISPVKNSEGRFYDSRSYKKTDKVSVPVDADSNGAYHIALKGLWAVKQIKQADDPAKAKIAISKTEWLKLAQTKDNIG